MHLATKICKTLACNFGDVFPAVKGREQTLKHQTLEQKFLTRGEIADEDASNQLDPDPLQWTLVLMLKGGLKHFFPVSAGTIKRLRRVANGRFPEFFCFDSGNIQAAVNLKHVVHFHTLWDHEEADLQPLDPSISENTIAVTLAGLPDPLKFYIEPGNNVDDEDRNSPGQVSELMNRLQEEPHCSEFINFQDEDGEDAFFRVEDIALITASQNSGDRDTTSADN